MIKYFCDTCGREIAVVKKKNPITNEYEEVLDVGKIKCEQINLSYLKSYNRSVHTCKHCAEKISLQIDNELLSLRLSLLSK